MSEGGIGPRAPNTQSTALHWLSQGTVVVRVRICNARANWGAARGCEQHKPWCTARWVAAMSPAGPFFCPLTRSRKAWESPLRLTGYVQADMLHIAGGVEAPSFVRRSW